MLTGCATPPGGWDSPEPAARLSAITDAARVGDPSAVPHLIESLNHDDPVVRLAAIRTLEQLTGQTLGYDYAAPEWRRQDKIAAWVDWYRQHTPDNPSFGREGRRAAARPGPIEGAWA
jgi:HEAT repeat protein